MAGINFTYRVVGRYMNGTEVLGYHFIGSDNSEIALDKMQTIYYINNNVIENMRTQKVNDEIIIRGKGVNLNNLPVYDENKQSFRNSGASKMISNSMVRPLSGNDIDKMTQFIITKRLMNKNRCLGYLVQDATGVEKKLEKKTVIELARNKRIANAVVQKYTSKENDIPQLILRGVKCDLSKLPIMILNKQGNFIDPSIISKDVTIRAVRIKHGGIITNTETNSQRRFEAGDYIVCKADGKLDVIKGVEFIKTFTDDKESDEATCDFYLDNIDKYTIEIFGRPVLRMNPNQIKVWAIAKAI